jgi:hypothetical protein
MFRSAGIIFYELVTFKRPFYNLREILNDKELEISNLEMNINFKQIINKFLIYNYYLSTVLKFNSFTRN